VRESPIALSTIVLVVLGVASCGGASKATRTASAHVRAPEPPPDNDQGYDRPSKSEGDDNASLHLGRPAGAAETRTVTGIVRRYYRAAAARDGASACSLIYSVTAAAIPENLGRPPGPPALRGNTCPVVMSKLFKQRHATMAADLAKLKIVAVRVSGDQAVALLKLGGGPERFISLRRERRGWKLDRLLDAEIP
jgi:hypothetical protein